MKKTLTTLTAIAMLALAATAGAVGTQVNFVDNPASNDITITLEIQKYATVEWQDMEIAFSDDLGVDYEAEQLEGVAYAPTSEKAATDAWAENFYESNDGAYLWVWSNCPVVMTVTPSGDLNNEAIGSSIPTWFTLAASGPFMLGSQILDDGTIPGDGIGSFAYEDSGSLVLPGGVAHFHPNQDAIPMAGPYTLNMAPSVGGNLMFKARIDRNGIVDPAGTYTATIGVTLATQ